MAGSAIKYYRFTWEFVMWGISIQNLQLLLQVIPDYEEDEDSTTVEEVDEDEFKTLFNTNTL